MFKDIFFFKILNWPFAEPLPKRPVSGQHVSQALDFSQSRSSVHGAVVKAVLSV